MFCPILVRKSGEESLRLGWLISRVGRRGKFFLFLFYWVLEEGFGGVGGERTWVRSRQGESEEDRQNGRQEEDLRPLE